MSKPVVEVEVRAVLPTTAGRAVFLGNEEKTFVIYVDDNVGLAITKTINQIPNERPMTHDLMANLMTAFGAKVERVIINDLDAGTYFARLILSAQNEVMEYKLVELDARPSDSIALAVAVKAPIYVSQNVWDEVEDMAEILQKMSDAEAEDFAEDDDDEDDDEDDDDEDEDDFDDLFNEGEDEPDGDTPGR